MDMFNLAGRVALVTGGAYGIGFAIAEALAGAGARILFNCSRQQTLDRGLAAYRQAGIEVKGYLCDVTDEEAVGRMTEDIFASVGPVDILVNNAGMIIRRPMLQTDTVDFRRVVDVDLTAPFIMAKALLPGMIKKGHGKIINVCSLMSELGRPTVAAYAAAKGGLKMLTRNICAEFAAENIQCNGIAPGYIATPQTEPLREPIDGEPNPFDVKIRKRTPAGRWGTPDDLKGPALFLASDASNFVNGQILYVDGGLLASLGV